MSAINHQDPGVAVLSKKLRGTAAASTVF
jgi:hypothetical protein